ncbi:MAG: cobyrinate a,c-diamide synthase [Oscillospiraceae bacterium]|nr:cobyrinate a,c-diamide synthase [Oscillospiraceae bacterium]MBP1560686.1 cobyrinate a,c-diamide synthase [Oscillospiraceae bacterium]
MKRIIIGGTHSGCGKTTVTCAVLQALCNRKMRVASFKCGPDYIDPMFHEKIIGTSAHNLDSFFCDNNTLKYLLCENSSNADISVIEGVMGFYDGVNGKGSACSVSEITDTKAIVVIDCKGQSQSIGAVMKGFLTYKKNNIIGFIFNRLPERLVPMVQKICDELNTEYFGFMPTNKITIESRHLGLVTADEIVDLKEKMQALADLAEKHILLDKIIDFSESDLPDFTVPEINKHSLKRPPVIVVAKDRAFCFLYSDNMGLLQKMGCEIRYFSPLTDKEIPEADGLILCGGYPELYAEQLSENKSMLNDIKTKISGGMPTIAECGGFMYLHNELEKDGKTYKMAGVIDGKVFKTDRLQRFGYITLTAQRDNLLCCKNHSFSTHEFHYWDSTANGLDFTAQKADGREWKCVHSGENFYAGFPHLYLYSDINLAENFVLKCAEYGEINE